MIVARCYSLLALAGMLLIGSVSASANAQQLDAHFSCSETRDDHGLSTIFADTGTIKVDGSTIKEFNWESSIFRSSHGLECSIDQDDGVQAEVMGDAQHDAWRFSLRDAKTARSNRGYDISHGFNCTIRVARIGDQVHIKPSCPALCGSRQNFSELTVNLKTGACQYEE
ncbi:MAG TPA: hypothetical protein VNW52_03805 [Burkholderiaceae bacterium]|jgi:hypothetical protein|nr:hypothetical protein [Burkholderiaceae bacterium]